MCPAVYIGQTRRPFITRFTEQQNAFRTYSGLSKFADHLLEENHPFGPIENIMTIVSKIQKGRHLATGKSYIYIKLQNSVYS
jgi:hypothetical protein